VELTLVEYYMIIVVHDIFLIPCKNKNIELFLRSFIINNKKLFLNSTPSIQVVGMSRPPPTHPLLTESLLSPGKNVLQYYCLGADFANQFVICIAIPATTLESIGGPIHFYQALADDSGYVIGNSNSLVCLI
jgi:hypothetical protein